MQRKDIEYVLQSLGVTEFKYTTDWVMCSCPLAQWTHESGTDLNPSFGVREGSGISPAHCFACGFRGGMISLIREYGKYGLSDGCITEEDVDQLIDYVLLAEEDSGEVRLRGAVLDQPVVVSSRVESCLNKLHPYFSERGITEESVLAWDLGWFEEDNRVLFPVFSFEGKQKRLRGVVGRTIVGEEPKWRNYPPKFKKSEFLYGEWLAPPEVDVLVVVEGPIDVILVNQSLVDKGFEKFWCVGLMGADPSKKQRDKMVSLGKEVCCMLDNDSSGKVGKLKIIGGRLGGKKFSGIGGRTVVSAVEWPTGVKDAGELDSDQITDLIKGRKFVLEEMLKRELEI